MSRFAKFLAEIPAPLRDTIESTLEPFSGDEDALAITLDLIEGLNPEQLEVVLHPPLGTPTLVLGGAGSGKTATLTRRLVFLLLAGVSPSAIFAVTFTRKAAEEMLARTRRIVARLADRASSPYDSWLVALGASLDEAWISTFHSAGLRILRERPQPFGGADETITNLERIGFGANARVMDERERKAVISGLVRSRERGRVELVEAAISNAKGGFLYPESFAKVADSAVEREAASVYADYHRLLRERELLDFDDLIFLCHELFDTAPDRLAIYQERFQSLLIDEYQDTNMGQYLFAQRLAATHHRVMSVGDDDQSIYGWRGADVDNLSRFLADYTDTRIIRLVRNYRSDANILGAANAIWKKKPEHLRKTLVREKPGADRGEPIRVVETQGAEAEGEYVAIEAGIAISGGAAPSSICVLARAHPHLDGSEEALRRAGITARRAGTLRSLASPAVIATLAHLDLVALLGRRISNTSAWRPGDTESLHFALKESLGGRVFSIPEEALDGLASVPDTAQLLLDADARATASGRFDRRLVRALDHLSSWAAERLVDGDGWRASTMLEHALDLLPPDAFAVVAGQRDPREELRDLAMRFETRSGTGENLPAERILAYTEEARARAGLVNDAGEIVEDAGGNEAGGGITGGSVRLMTIHAAKGLEFDHVFLVAASDEILPMRGDRSRVCDKVSAADEELRLFYVAVSRARLALHIIHAHERPGMNGPRSFKPSPFIKLIPKELTLTIR